MRVRVMRGAVDGGCWVPHPHAGAGVGLQHTRTLVQVWVFPLLVFYTNCVIAPAESKRGYDDLMSLLLCDDDNDDDDVAENHRELTEMESPAQLHGCKTSSISLRPKMAASVCSS